jgi:tetratricopeptide (TPR) repeat protein
MIKMYADFNAMTEADGVRLTTRGSQEDMERLGIRPGDWTWLTDSELIVGALVATDSYFGLVGAPDWKTLVHLDDEDDRDPNKIQAELRDLLQKFARSMDEELRIFQLLTLFEEFAAPEARSVFRPGYFAFRRAGALLALGKPELALVEIEEARRIDSCQPTDDRLFLEILRRIDLPRARREAESLAAGTQVSAGVQAECINVLATHADLLPNDEFEPVGRRILEWAEWFELAVDRPSVAASTLAQVLFNRGLILLRLGKADDARRDLDLARVADPKDPQIREATTLTAYGQAARDLAARVRDRAIAA